MFRNPLLSKLLVLAVLIGSAGALEARDQGVLYAIDGTAAGYVLHAPEAFEKGASSLTDQGRSTLTSIVAVLRRNVAQRVSIFGYTDAAGNTLGKRKLSLDRALAVKDYLLSAGIAADRIVQVDGLGPEQPLAPDTTEAGRDINRRVEIQFAGKTLDRRMPVHGDLDAEDAAAQSPSTGPIFGGGPQGASHPLALGLGYPDVRLRFTLGYGFDVEAKIAFEQGIQVYSGRLYWNFWDYHTVHLVVGAEGGYARFNQVDGLGGTEGLDGAGSAYECFLGLEYPFAGRLKLSADVGPALLSGSAQGYTYSTTQTIVNLALYIYLY